MNSEDMNRTEVVSNTMTMGTRTNDIHKSEVYVEGVGSAELGNDTAEIICSDFTEKQLDGSVRAGLYRNRSSRAPRTTEEVRQLGLSSANRTEQPKRPKTQPGRANAVRQPQSSGVTHEI